MKTFLDSSNSYKNIIENVNISRNDMKLYLVPGVSSSSLCSLVSHMFSIWMSYDLSS